VTFDAQYRGCKQKVDEAGHKFEVTNSQDDADWQRAMPSANRMRRYYRQSCSYSGNIEPARQLPYRNLS
jgi:hypothetical protein